MGELAQLARVLQREGRQETRAPAPRLDLVARWVGSGAERAGLGEAAAEEVAGPEPEPAALAALAVEPEPEGAQAPVA